MDAVIAAVLIGLTLGLLGSGGSILTVPALVYLVGHEGKTAIAESLAIVGSIALIATLPYAWERRVDWRRVLGFGVPGMIGAYAGAWISQLVSGGIQLVLFAAVMLAAAWLMFRPPKENAGAAASIEEGTAAPPWLIAVQGLGVGVLTGLVGVGGGFLIVPALVLFGRLPMHKAVGTSLPIIVLNAYTGLARHVVAADAALVTIDWGTIALFVAVGAVGTYAGRFIGKRLDQMRLRRIFAVFLIGMGVFVLWRETPGLIHADTTPAARSIRRGRAAAQLGQIQFRPRPMVFFDRPGGRFEK